MSHVLSCYTDFGETLRFRETHVETQNITLAIPKYILMKVKWIAVQRQTSVSGLLTRELERLVQREDAYVHARQRHLDCMEQDSDLGTNGRILARRDELHERGV